MSADLPPIGSRVRTTFKTQTEGVVAWVAEFHPWPYATPDRFPGEVAER